MTTLNEAVALAAADSGLPAALRSFLAERLPDVTAV